MPKIPEAERLADQAIKTSINWMREASDYVDHAFPSYSREAKATLISALVIASAGDETAMHLRAIAMQMGD